MASEWQRSSVAAPMTRLEFELFGQSYARGYGAALASFQARAVEAVARLYKGHLYTSIREGGAQPGALDAVPLEPSLHQWSRVVRPVIKDQLVTLRDLADQEPGPAMRKAADLFADSVSLHHRLMLPARQVVENFVSEFAARPAEPAARRLPSLCCRRSAAL